MDRGGGMVIPPVMDTLETKASFLRESLRKSQDTTEGMVKILGSLDRRLSALDSAMRPTHVRTHTIGMACGNIDKTLKSADVILRKFVSSREAEANIRKGPHEDLKTYMTAIDELRSNLYFFSSMKTFRNRDRVVNHINNILVEAILKLEEEFKRLLSAYSQALERHNLVVISPSPSHPESPGNLGDPDAGSLTEQRMENVDKTVYEIPVLIPARVLPLLHDLALEIVRTGNRQECIEAYRESHAPVLERTLKKLGVVDKEDVKRLPEALKAKTDKWIGVMRIAMKSVFAGEKQVCHQIFHDIDSLKDLCFAAAIENSVEMLLSFVHAVVRHRWPLEELIPLLDMYAVMCELRPEIETIFGGDACSKMRESALNLTRQLAKTVRIAFGDFEKRVTEEDSKINDLDGPRHSLTSYVMNFLKKLLDHRSILEICHEEPDAGNEANHGPANVIGKIITALLSNLEGKSQKYNETALRHFFLMNNVSYMVRYVRELKAEKLVGDDWVPRHRKIVQQNANKYIRAAWMPILQILTIQGSNTGGSGVGGTGGSSGVSRSLVKERFKAFNTQFEELLQRQSQWTVEGAELRESLRLWIVELFLPAYRNFIKRFGPLVDGTKNQEKFWKYTPEDAARHLPSGWSVVACGHLGGGW
ncbi:unnamed protein product [Spirodela intermedia]|uniref:Exocyst subunit Exo70 family protein n=1 Tax=Spirodela intermedia TaxID=51605 RepID=A0A7I8JBZ5_SPIIN|nr:unnamed protein product [Spirodela intermedia]CAA6667624.1 unnamed protein product [Spirodela intermedia]